MSDIINNAIINTWDDDFNIPNGVALNLFISNLHYGNTSNINVHDNATAITDTYEHRDEHHEEHHEEQYDENYDDGVNSTTTKTINLISHLDQNTPSTSSPRKRKSPPGGSGNNWLSL